MLKQVKQALSAVTLIGFVSACSTAASAAPNRYIDAENATINSTTLTLTDNGRTYVHIKKGEFVNPWISPSQYYKGTHGIGFEMNPTSGTAPDGQSMDKSNFRIIAGNEADALGFLEDKYTGFAVKLETNFDLPEKPVQLFQWWQGSPFSPPLELRVKPNSTDYEFVYRNDTTGRGPTAAKVLYTGSMTKGQWVSFVVYTRMSTSTDVETGNIKIWVNGSLVKDWNGDVGYDASTDYYYKDGYYRSNPKFDIFFGLYRDRQMKHHKAIFDQIKFGTSYNDVDPDQ